MTQAMTAGPDTKTPAQKEKERRDMEMARTYRLLLEEEPGRSLTMVKNYLKNRYRIHSDSGYYAALERGLRLIAAEEGYADMAPAKTGKGVRS